MKNYNIPITATNKTDSTFNAINKNVKSVSNNLLSAKGAFAGFLGVAAVNQLTGFAKDSLEFADAIGKTADKLGVSTDALQEYRFAAERSGVASNALDVGIQRFTRRLGEAAEGTGVLSEVLKEQNIQVRDAEGNLRNTEDVLNDYADAIKNATTDQQKLLLAFKAFDTGGADMVNMLRNGSQGLETLKQTAREAGAVMDEDLIRSAEELNDQWETLTTAISVDFKSAMIGTLREASSAFKVVQKDTTVIAEWLAAYQNDHISFFEWMTTGNEEAAKKLESMQNSVFNITETMKKTTESKDLNTGDGPLIVSLGLTDFQKQEAITREQMVLKLIGENTQIHNETEEQKQLDSNERKRQNALAFLRQGEEDTREDANRRLMIEQNLNRQKQAAVASTFGVLSTLMSARSKKLFKIGKTAAIASALINTYQAVTKTMAETPYPWNIPLAAAQGLAGMVQVQNIRSQQFGGGGGGTVGGGGGGGGVSTGAGLPTSNTFNPPFNPFQDDAATAKTGVQTIINFYNSEFLSDESISNLTESLGDYLERTDNILIRGGSRNALELKGE